VGYDVGLVVRRLVGLIVGMFAEKDDEDGVDDDRVDDDGCRLDSNDGEELGNGLGIVNDGSIVLGNGDGIVGIGGGPVVGIDESTIDADTDGVVDGH